jgi:hypothetical protein
MGYMQPMVVVGRQLPSQKGKVFWLLLMNPAHSDL